MAYTSKAQLIDRWGTDEVTRSADRDPQDGVSEDQAIAAACADASSMVDSYLVQAGIEVPVDPAPAVLTMHATNIAMYELSQGAAPYTEEKRKRYEDAIAWLKVIANGDGSLPGQEDADKPATATVRSGGFGLRYQAGNLRGGGLL